MPRSNVEYNNKWACYSHIVDGFVTRFMDKSDYEIWRKRQYGTCDYKPTEECNMITLKEAISSIRIHNNHNETLSYLIDVGLSKEESEKLLYDLETEHYCPVLQDNGKYECPNCSSEVELGQVVCKDETCELEFVWR